MNKNTWTKDYTGEPGLSTLAARDALRKGHAPKSKTAETLKKAERN